MIASAIVERRLADLGWGGVPFITAFTNIAWLYLSAGLDADVPSRLIGSRSGRDGNHARACCRLALEGMLNEAERVGRLEILRRPCVRDPFEVLETMQRLYGR